MGCSSTAPSSFLQINLFSLRFGFSVCSTKTNGFMESDRRLSKLLPQTWNLLHSKPYETAMKDQPFNRECAENNPMKVARIGNNYCPSLQPTPEVNLLFQEVAAALDDGRNARKTTSKLSGAELGDVGQQIVSIKNGNSAPKWAEHLPQNAVALPPPNGFSPSNLY